MKRFVLLALAACGGANDTNAGDCPDAGPACGSACSATFTGNFDASSVGAENCAHITDVTDVVLGLSLSAAGLDAPLAVSIDLGGSPIPGTYSSETATNWSALGSRSSQIGSGGECVYSAGADGVPMGSFQLTLESIDATSAHGELSIVQYVQAQESVDCGSDDNEYVDARF